MLDFVFLVLVCTFESVVYCFYNVKYADYIVYLIAAILFIKIYNFLFRFRKKPVVKHTQPTVSKKEKLLVIWDELDDDEKDDYKSVMTEDEWLDFKYELVKRQRTNKS